MIHAGSVGFVNLQKHQDFCSIALPSCWWLFRSFSYGVQKWKWNLTVAANLISPTYVKYKNISILGLFKNNLLQEEQFFLCLLWKMS